MENIEEFKKNINIIKRDFYKSWGDIYIQFGFNNSIFDIASVELKKEENIENIKKIYENKKSLLNKELGLISSIRENMPPANVIVNISKSEDEIWSNISKNTKNQIKKGKSKGLEFVILSKDNINEFYDLWYKTLFGKGLSIPGRKEYFQLYDYLKENKVGDIFAVKLDGKLVAGSICIYSGDILYYVYGASDRDAGNIGQHQYLKYQLFIWAKEKGFKKIDLLGVAPAWNKSHSLAGVSDFKNSLGGDYIQYLGNYDLVFSDKVYKIYNTLKK
ncbi:lipid II:glycine glycyltransferase FemX [Candidatus Vampirococcus lugosii]|uniref:Lipid II:glycine glycyltransferase (Peptidoglycan interpeptide bridge formation enzyme) n=1 Tax=Candidatus Vampirococcus lugosii TaxID=2789015 RepID=A0ABS5QK92_9BACT|nr:peptidoglycan bridge formation glycyltransferase FemA/FemB family protein [Candidatus Vampirococcus lugosii]MBS8121512.1 Lipid II:glycine glycyltransferase (Peptidoglycan interpeptide bridge formation enzyme) [Candidatus Vampirococcus lugosii]